MMAMSTRKSAARSSAEQSAEATAATAATDEQSAETTETTAEPGAPTPSYEQAREELAGIVVELEDGGQSLEEALARWERGEELAAICQRWLDNARERLQAAREDTEPDLDA